MSFWINRHKCKNCGSIINITGGMIGTTWMGPEDRQVVCPNPTCLSTGFNSFENIGPCDIGNPEHAHGEINHTHNGTAD
jgi:hypothetical protein